MIQRLPIALLALSVLLPASAGAAELTSTPPMLRGDIRVGYSGGLGLVGFEDRAGLDDVFVDVGRYARVQQGMVVGGTFAAYHGIAFRLELPIVFYDALRWEAANDFIYDPVAANPTAAGASPLPQEVLDASPSSRHHAGPGDMVLGLRIVPFAEQGVPGREAPASMAFDVDLLMPSGGHHDAVREDGTAGPGWGGAQVRLGLSGSRRFGTLEPFVGIHYTHRGPYRVDLSSVRVQPDTEVEEDGRTRLDPADEFGFRFGSELIAMEDSTADTSMRLAMGFGLTYVGPHELSSGTLLPAPLEATVGHRARSSEHLLVDLLFGLRIRPKPEAELYVDWTGGWTSPHSVEQVNASAYTVRTAPSSFHLSWGVGATIRVR